MDPTVYTVPSRGTLRIPTERLVREGRLIINPAVQEKGYFSVHFQGEDLVLAAGRYCGLIPINPQVSIDVRPKMQVENLARIYEVASLSMRRIEGLNRRYDFIRRSTNMPVLEFLGAEFLALLRPIIEHGLRKEYHPRFTVGQSPRGRIAVGTTFTHLWARGEIAKVASSAFQHELDMHANRVLKAAGELIIRRLLAIRSANDLLIRELARALTYFQGVGRLDRLDWARVERRSAFHASDENYQLALTLASGVLAESDVGIEAEGQEIDLSAVVVDFEALFENYIRNSLRLMTTARGSPILIEDGNTTGKKPLFDSSLKPTAEPDIVLTDPRGRPILLGEVKYKTFPDRADINQVVTYAASYRLPNIVLVHQTEDPANVGLTLHGRIGALHIWRYGFPLDRRDLEAEEVRFADAVLRLVNDDEVDGGNVRRLAAGGS
jgi:5-methylcytosine-specific restriction enzyme subunit McrC